MVDEFARTYLCSGHFTPNGANFLGPALLFLEYNSTHNPCVLGIEPQCRSWVLWFWLITQGAWAQHATEVTNQSFHSLKVVWRKKQFSHRGVVDCIPLQMACSGFHSSRSSCVWYWFYSCAHLSRTWWKVFTKALKDDTSYSAFEVPSSIEGKSQAESISCKQDINISSLWMLESSAPSCLWHPSIFWTFE